MCNPNTHTIAAIDFGASNDEFSWLSNSIYPITTVNDRLVLKPDSALSTFSRGLGALDISNNRVGFKLNLEIFRPANGGAQTVNYVVQLLNNSAVIDQSTIYIENIGAGQTVSYSLDRVYTYAELNGNLSIKIKTPIGFENEIRLINLIASDFNYCDDNLKTYFIFEGFFDIAKQAQSAGLRLRSYKIGGVETLTPDFNIYNQTNVGGDPTDGWKFAKADLDGANRESDVVAPNSFNPFIDEWGLEYSPTNYFSGLPTGTAGGQNFGAGVMKVGVDKPAVLNGILEPMNGAFFINIDYTQELYIEVDVLANDVSTDVYNSPTFHRRYFIKWDPTKCSGAFEFLNMLTEVPTPQDQYVNGFLTGLTGTEVEDIVLPCGQTLQYTGNQGTFSFVVDLGTGVGMAGFDYNAQDVPDKFDIEWNGILFTTNYRGKNTYNQALINAGVPISEIQTALPSNGAGQLLFYKSSSLPSTAIVTVKAPLSGTAWFFTGICPLDYMVVEIGRLNCEGSFDESTIMFTGYMEAENYLDTFIPANGKIIYSNTSLTTPLNGEGAGYKMRILISQNGYYTYSGHTFKVSNTGVISDLTLC